MSPGRPIALTIAGSDSSGGAGIQADLKTFGTLGVYGASAITALTAQNTQGVTGVLATPADFVTAQIDAVCADLPVNAVKTGMLPNAAIIHAVAAAIGRHKLAPVVVDPVMVATSGASLIDDDAIRTLRERLVPLAALVTPNIPEAARLTEQPEAHSLAEMERQARLIQSRFGARAVLIKGGHGEAVDATDLLLLDDGSAARAFTRPRIETRSTHGTGCTLAAAIAAHLACGFALPDAVQRSKDFVWKALAAGSSLAIGHGHGPIDHLVGCRPPTPPPV